MSAKFIRLSGLASTKGRPGRWPCSGATVWRNVADGTVPSPVKLAAQVTAWLTEEIEAVEKARIAGCSDDQVRDLVRQLHAARTFGQQVAVAPADISQKVAAGAASAAKRRARHAAEATT